MYHKQISRAYVDVDLKKSIISINNLTRYNHNYIKCAIQTLSVIDAESQL